MCDVNAECNRGNCVCMAGYHGDGRFCEGKRKLLSRKVNFTIPNDGLLLDILLRGSPSISIIRNKKNKKENKNCLVLSFPLLS